MKKGITLSAMLCLLGLGTTSTAHAEFWQGDCNNSCGLRSFLDFDIGYRSDKFLLSTVAWAENPINPNFAFTGVFQQMKHINSVQVGLSGLWNAPCSNFYFRGEFHWSKPVGNSGHYKEYTPLRHGLVGFPFHQLAEGNICGNMWDVNLALGHLFDVSRCWGIAPVIGYSYDSMCFKNRVNDLTAVPSIPRFNITTKQRFNSAFVGFDTLFRINSCIDYALGYELHWAAWREKETGPEFSQHMKSNNMWGNLFRIESYYTFCGGWNFGIELKYQFWRNMGNDNEWNATASDGFSTSDPSVQEHILAEIAWDSFSALARIGFGF